VIAILLFGDRLPEVMRSLGRGMSEFKKGLRGIEGAIDSAANSPSRSAVTHREIDDREEITAPRFVPPPSEPRIDSNPPASSQEPVQRA